MQEVMVMETIGEMSAARVQAAMEEETVKVEDI